MAIQKAANRLNRFTGKTDQFIKRIDRLFD